MAPNSAVITYPTLIPMHMTRIFCTNFLDGACSVGPRPIYSRRSTTSRFWCSGFVMLNALIASYKALCASMARTIPRNVEACPHLRKMRHVGAIRELRDWVAPNSIGELSTVTLQFRRTDQDPVSLRGLGRAAHPALRGGGWHGARHEINAPFNPWFHSTADSLTRAGVERKNEGAC